MYHSYIAQQVMPNLNDLPEYKKIYYRYRHMIILFPIFSADSMLLVVTYDDTIYQMEKLEIDNLNFLEKAKYRTTNGTYYQLPEPEFQINSFNFRILAESQENDFDYPKYIGIIATSDEKKSVAYLYFADQDLDYISVGKTEDEMAKFVDKYFKYKW
jgi:hypothetical protein